MKISKHLPALNNWKFKCPVMNLNSFCKILLGTVAFLLLIILFTTVFVEPWVRKKIQTAFNEKNKNYIVVVDKVHLVLIRPGIELKNITIYSKRMHENLRELKVEIAFMKFSGIDLVNAIFSKKLNIRKIIVSDSRIIGAVRFPEEAELQLVSAFNMRIGSITFNKIYCFLKNASTFGAYSVKEGVLKLWNVEVKKKDTISPGIIKQFDFKAEELKKVSADNMHTYTVNGIVYSSSSNTLAIDKFTLQPNYTDYDFTSRYVFQKERIEASFSHIFVHGFSAIAYLNDKNLVSSYIEIGKLDMNIFRDKRKEFKRRNKPAFQEMIYNYPGLIQIDSIGLLTGNVCYTQHPDKANKPGSSSFNEIHAKIYKITNDAVYKTESAFLKLRADALFMGKSRMDIVLKAKIFDEQNTFSVNGTFSEMETNTLNSVLENNAFISVKAGKLDEMNFSFMANNSNATGKMTMLYHGLKIELINKRTDEPTAIKEKIMSIFANMKIIDSNPVPGKEVREGLIYYEREPERFLMNYCFKSIVSGIKSSLGEGSK
ncbi:MAG: hypothetical protein CVU00_02675 [Bacteroidetes bacterium HGW-Bacteroidetes-17]|jgi:hypothetical protein|nr:MAG: hypothetical protein CVU00_02675 [Bacteroidetes bacterium HGW-Bacteroidetes-17]